MANSATSSDAADIEALIKSEEPEASRVTGIVRLLLIVFVFLALILNMNKIGLINFILDTFLPKSVFNWWMHSIYEPTLIIDTSYYYIIIGLLLSLVFLIYPFKPTKSGRVPFYDWILFFLTMLSAAYLAYNGENIIQKGWDIIAPTTPTIIAGIMCLLCLEGVRRAGGGILFGVCLFFFFYPMFAEYMPGFLWGPPAELDEFVRQHAMGTESIIGVPMRAVTNLLIGFLVFGSALVVTGGGNFFLAFATALLGRTRGGPAKVAIISSGFFGSLSGSVISNVVTTGKITIPTMKRVGYPPTYAAAVEACASTGGALMPPVMGAVAFLMAENLNMPYADIIIAAAVPAILFYLALLLQVDNYAAKVGLKGQPAEEIPEIWPTFISGWHYLFSLAALIYMLIGMRIEVFAPYFATFILIVTSILTSFLRKEKVFGFGDFIELLVDAGKTIVNIVGILVGIGMIIGALSLTGVGPAFSSELLRFAEGSVWLLLILGAVTSFVLGMGMTVSACYIFLAVVMGGAMADGGLNPVAGHLFILYWGMMSYITPPVAVAAVAASTIAGSPPMETGFRAMRLGGILFILPFMFALNPTLILVGETWAIVHDVTTAVIAVWMLASALEGWLYGSGRIAGPLRVILGVAALGALHPDPLTDFIALAGLGAVYVLNRFMKPKGVIA